MSAQHEISDGEKIPETLGHLLALDQQEPGMKPIARKLLTAEGLGLRNFIFVMRKNQVFAAGMQVETRPQFLHRHHRALDMPARTPWPDRCLPRRLARLRSFP